MRTLLGFSALAGLLLAAFLTLHHGLAAVGGVLRSVGWGLLIVAAVHLVQVVLSALGWRAALAPARASRLPPLVALRWTRESVNSLLPVAQIGGEVVGARLLALRGVPVSVAAASVVVDTTYEVLTQFLFTLLGLLLYFASGYRSDFDHWMALGLLATVPVLGAFIAAQRHGLFRHVERFLNWLSARLPVATAPGRIDGLHDDIQVLYGDWRAVAAGCMWHTLSWIGGTVEVWLILYFAGAPVGFKEAFILESLGQAVRTAAFIVPGAFGVQEGGYLLLGTLFGLAPEVGLGLSLAKRGRELLLGLPGMLAWQWIEGRRLIGSRPASPQATGTE